VVAARAERVMDSDPVVRRWRLGLTDKEIAAELVLTNLQVATKRRSFGLPANRRKSIG
jgi:hypothetical protein